MQESDSKSESAVDEAVQRSKRLFGNQPDGGDGIAKVLREAREKKHEEIARISGRLRIRAAYLQAIEEGRYRDLPGDAYAIGFVRAYANYLGLDGEEIVRRFKNEASVSGKSATLVFPIPAREGRAPKAIVLLLSVLLALVVYGVWYGISDRPPTPIAPSADIETTEPVAAQAELEEETVSVGAASIEEGATEETPAEAPIAETPPALAGTGAASEPEGAGAPPARETSAPEPASETVSSAPEAEAATMIVLRARRDTWIEIRDAAGRPMMTGVLYTNQIYRPPLQEGLTLAVGDAHGVEILVGGTPIPPLGTRGVILRKVLLDPARLKAGNAVLD